jgi:hypothetical protein
VAFSGMETSEECLKEPMPLQSACLPCEQALALCEDLQQESR